MKITPEQMKDDEFGDWRYAFECAVRDTTLPVGERWNFGDAGHYHGHGHAVNNVSRVIAADEGENDESDWIAIVEWSGPEGNFAVMGAGCDYTGWG